MPYVHVALAGITLSHGSGREEQQVFFPDLLDFLIWEEYGLTDDEIEGYFKGITPDLRK